MNQSHQRLTFHLSTPDQVGEPICVAGNFNDWNENGYQLQKTESGAYEGAFDLEYDLSKPIEYKFLRSRWANVELDEYGGGVPNRIVVDPQETIRAWVPRWRHEGRSHLADLLPLIRYHYDLTLPRSRKKRRISVLLPYDYDQQQKSYPVLYMMDGQNLFEDGAPFGSWEIHKRLAVLAEKKMHEVIIVCIDHAGTKRVEEYNYIRHYLGEKGRGHEFVDWIVDKLIPFINSHYRTKAEQFYTGIGGSSMGGLISLMAGTTHPNVFGKLMIFSPSLWKIVDIMYDRFMYLPLVSFNQDIYLYAGGREASNMKGFVQDFYDRLTQADPANDRVHYAYNEPGRHSENYWGSEFPFALKYLFY
jgi:predicted alpha/beta superfamily hydrolase